MKKNKGNIVSSLEYFRYFQNRRIWEVDPKYGNMVILGEVNMQIVNSYRILHLHLYLEASWHKGYLALKSENQLRFYIVNGWMIMNVYYLADK